MRVIPLLFLLLAACDRGHAVPTSAQNRDLDEAGQMLDNAEDNLSGIDESIVNPPAPDPQI